MNDDDIFQQAIDAADKAEPDAAPATSPANTTPPASAPSTAIPPETTAPGQPNAVVRALNGAEAVWRSMGAGIRPTDIRGPAARSPA